MARPAAAAYRLSGPRSPWPPWGSRERICVCDCAGTLTRLDVTDAAQLDQALDALLAGPAADRPLIAYLAGGAGALGLGLDPVDGGVLLFAPADRGRPALHGVGPAAGTEGDVVFAVSGRPYRFSGRCRVPAATVRAAAR
jgi:hypothetical protein